MPQTGLQQPKSKEEAPAQHSVEALSGHHNTNDTPYQRDNSQHPPREDVAGIHTKNRPHTKNITHAG